MQFETFDLGLIGYKEAWLFQQEIFEKVKSAQISSALIFCRHYPVITLGRRALEENILVSREELFRAQVEVHKIERGGDVTYHGPGQLIAYPIFNLNYLKKDIHWFLRQLEDVIIALLFDFGIEAQRRAGLTGVWISDKKISAIGIAIKNWITFHGISLNILNEPAENFKFIKPCGMNIEVTSMEEILGQPLEIGKVKEDFRVKFEKYFV